MAVGGLWFRGLPASALRALRRVCAAWACSRRPAIQCGGVVAGRLETGERRVPPPAGGGGTTPLLGFPRTPFLTVTESLTLYQQPQAEGNSPPSDWHRFLRTAPFRQGSSSPGPWESAPVFPPNRFGGCPFILPVQGEVNPPCTKVFLRKTLVRRTGGDGRRCVQAVSFLRT